MLIIVSTSVALVLASLGLRALSANAVVASRKSDELHYTAAVQIHRNALVGLHSSGGARPMAAGAKFLGIAINAAAAGEVVEVATDREVTLTGSGFAATDVGKDVFATADDTVAVGAGRSRIGVCTGYISATQIRVKLNVDHAEANPHALKLNSVASAANVTVEPVWLNGVLHITGTTAGNLNLPAAATAGAGAWITFVKLGASGALTVEPSAAETIDGGANNSEMDAARDTMTIVSDGVSDWSIVAKKIAG